MVKVNWTVGALDDMDAIAEYISVDLEKYASIFVAKVFERVQILKYFPKGGRMVPEVEREDIRELTMGKYRIIYKVVNNQQVDILTVHLSARPLPGASMFD